MSPISARIQVVTASISLIASSVTSFMVARPTNGGLDSPYRRIILGLSVTDIVQSIALVSGPWSMPPGIPLAPWGAGNIHTCRFNGVLLIFSTGSTAMYTAGLCMYYRNKIRERLHDEHFSHAVEWKLHIITIASNYVAALLGIFSNTIHAEGVSGSFCYVSPSPVGCCTEPEIYGECEKEWATRLFSAFPFALSFISLVVVIRSIFMLLRHIHAREKVFTSGKLLRSGRALPGSILNVNQTQKSEMHENSFDQVETNANFNHDIVDASTEKKLEESKSSIEEVTAVGDKYYDHHHDQQSSKYTHDENDNKEEPKMNTVADLSRLIKRETAIQGISYIAAFCMAYIPSILLQISSYTGFKSSAITVIWSILFPLRGLFTIFIFTRPKVVFFRRRYPQFSRMQAFWLVLKHGGGMPADPPPHWPCFGACRDRLAKRTLNEHVASFDNESFFSGGLHGSSVESEYNVLSSLFCLSEFKTPPLPPAPPPPPLSSPRLGQQEHNSEDPS